MRTKTISLLALLLLAVSACTEVKVSVHQSDSSSAQTGTNCKLQRELRNQHQETNVWCWAASSAVVIEYLKNDPIDQCTLVDALYRSQLKYEWGKGLPANSPVDPDPPNCCLKMPEHDPAPTHPKVTMAQSICYQNGWPEYIFFTEEFRTHFNGYEYDWTIPYPHGLRWDEIVEEICADRPMISAILYAPELGGGAHTVVIGGYNELEDGSQWVHVYDPGSNTGEDDYYLWPYDVYLGDPGVFIHVRDYKNISLQ